MLGAGYGVVSWGPHFDDRSRKELLREHSEGRTSASRQGSLSTKSPFTDDRQV